MHNSLPIRTFAESGVDLSLADLGVTPKKSHHLLEARVVEVEVGAWGGELRLEVAPHGAPFVARRAASCLLEPSVADRVLVSQPDDRGAAYVLAVLEREDADASAELGVAGANGDVRLRAAGTLNLEGGMGLRLITRRAMQMVAGRAELVAGEMVATARRAVASANEAGLIATTLDTTVERVTTRAARAFRFISEMDQTRAKHIDSRASETARLSSAGATMVTSHQVVKVDGSQVHVG